MLAIIDTWLGNGDAALQRLARSRAIARELRHRLAEAMNEEVTGLMLVAHGRFDEAHGHLTHGLALAREIGARRYELMCLMLLARVDWHRGDQRRGARQARQRLGDLGADVARLHRRGGAGRHGAGGGERRRAAAARWPRAKRCCASTASRIATSGSTATRSRRRSRPAHGRSAERYASALEDVHTPGTSSVDRSSGRRGPRAGGGGTRPAGSGRAASLPRPGNSATGHRISAGLQAALARPTLSLVPARRGSRNALTPVAWA